jgi:hypothetical protein
LLRGSCAESLMREDSILNASRTPELLQLLNS